MNEHVGDPYVDGLRDSTDPSIAYRARRLLDGVGEEDVDQQRRRQRIAASRNVRRLLAHRPPDGTIRYGSEHHCYRKFQGAHWTLAALAELGYPTGDETLLPVVDRGTFADWGPSGRTRANPYVSLDATWVLQQAAARGSAVFSERRPRSRSRR